MKHLIACLAIALLLAGCSTPLGQVLSTAGAVASGSVPVKAVVIAANAFDAAEATGKNILVACTPAVRPRACNDAALRQLIAAIRAGRSARDGLEAFLAAHPGQLGSKGLFDALTAATGTITKVVATYNAGAAS